MTLIECLVVIGIVALLAAILIPAILFAREAGRRATCQNNLRQIGIGMSSYASTAGCLPMAQGHRGGSPLVSILPFVEQQSLYNSLNFADPSQITVDSDALPGLRLALYLCPADPVSGSEPGDAWTSYAGNRGVGVQRYGENGAFAFPPGSIVAWSDFTDGTTHTAMYSEWIIGVGEGGTRDPLRGTFRTAGRFDQPGEFDRFADECHQLNPATAGTSSRRKGANWLHGEFGMSLYNHTLGPNDHTCLNGSGYQIGAWTAGSRHPGTVNSAFADGSVRPVRQAVSLQVWRALGSRNGHEVNPSAGDF